MRLKSIEMQGFKSFADKIYLDFNSGITAIVGPNGSGKSNISDAIRWVMGEQSIKSLRGSRMEDVIFSGTEARKALGFAEVTLILDNTDSYFPLDFPEISVTRRVYRSGEGEYYINKTLCRLKDIHELFMDTGLGRDGYSIIGQGKIDNILSTKSEDRRQIFEEAAGISKYKYRKIEAERKLTQTVDNLTRIRDILTELESQLGPLSKQSEKAKKYLVLRDELRGLDINASIINIDRIKEEQTALKKDLDILLSQIEDITAELAETDAAISSMYDKMREDDNLITALSEEERDITLKVSEAEKNEGILKNDIEHNKSNIERLEIEINHILESVKLADEELSSHRNNLSALNAELEHCTLEIEEITALSTKADETAGEKGGVLDELRGQLINITSEINSLRGSIENLKILNNSFNERKAEASIEFNSRNQQKNELNDLLNIAAEKEEKIKADIKKEEDVLDSLEDELKSSRDEIEKISTDYNKHLLELSQKRSRRTMLMDMERELEGYAKGVKDVMNAYNDGVFGQAKIYGPLAQLIKTDNKYIVAIETALGAASQNIVTESENEAKKAIAFLKEKHLGRATFLPVSAIKARTFNDLDAKKCDGFISVADELIECEDKFKAIVSSFLGNTVVCDNIDNAVSMAKKCAYKFRIVTFGGDVVQAGGAMTGGSVAKSTGSLSRSGEIDTLAKEIDKLKIITKEEEDKKEKLSADIFEKNNIIENLHQKISAMYADAVRAESDKERYSVLVENINTSGQQLEKEMSDIEVRISDLTNDIKSKEELISQKEKERLNVEKIAEKAQEEFGRLSGESEKLSLRLTEISIKKSTLLKDIELENERITGLNDTKSAQLESVNIKRGGIDTLISRNKSIDEEILTLVSQCEKLQLKANECRTKTEELNKSRLETEGEIRKRQNEVKDTQEKKFALSQRASKLEARDEKLSSERENIINRMWEDYELTYSDALELKQDGEFDYKAATIRIRELKDSIKSLGNINIDAIEEYKNVKERFDFLTVQTQDLEKAKEELDSVISEMMDLMQTRFAEQFRIINTNFSRVFSELFGGGRANLSLTEPDNVLESGIEIEAQPPGKKLQSLTLLSGGEKAFTAIALLFAILDVRPTPFCILDEIEAALDDVNVYRYADYLRRYSNKTQFIVVTHRRGTMEAANVLYGVTMQERGISKLLSLNIDEVKE